MSHYCSCCKASLTDRDITLVRGKRASLCCFTPVKRKHKESVKAQKTPPTREQLHELYETNGKSCSEIGMKFNYSKSYISKKLKEFNIKTRTQKEVLKMRRPSKFII